VRLRELKLEEMEQVVGGASEPSPVWMQLPNLPEPWPGFGIVPSPRQPEERE